MGIRCETEQYDNKTRDKELKELSDFLRHRADVMGFQHDDTFRNYAGIRKQYFFRVLSVVTHGKKGTPSSSPRPIDFQAMKIYENDPDNFKEIVDTIYRKYK